MRGSWGWPTEFPKGVQGQNPCRGSGVLCSSGAEAKCYVNVNVLCIKNIQDFIGKGVELMAVNWVQSDKWKQTQPYTVYRVAQKSKPL